MIIQNGYVQYIENSGGGLDDNGYPTAPTTTYGTAIPCQYQANSHSYLGKSNGEAFIRASYTILVEYDGVREETERLRLSDKAGNKIGDFSVLMFEPLDAVCQMRILV